MSGSARGSGHAPRSFARCRRVTRLTKFAAAAATDEDGQEICEPCLAEAGVLLTAENFMLILPAQDVDDLFDRLADATVQGANINERLSTIAKSFMGFVVTVPTLCTIALNSIGRLATRAAQADLASALRQVAGAMSRGAEVKLEEDDDADSEDDGNAKARSSRKNRT